MLTDVRGGDKIRLMIPMFEDPGQDFWWKLVHGYICVLDNSYYPQNLREIPLDAGDLWAIRSSVRG